MSRTQTSGAIWSGHLRYTAHALEECLDNAIRARSVSPAIVPTRLVDAGTTFLRTALRAGQGTDDPSTSIANYRIAAKALRGSNSSAHGVRDLRQPLQDQLTLLESLTQPRRLSGADVKSLEQLRAFFKFLFQAAEARSYGEAVDEKLDEELRPPFERR
jgi:hypothetical protein